ncbi:major facilitator superfamily [Diatrype stigma]|uniref:Major facilitator superfamily n=1 Tax=Diatrype stigma TaxID=117547 RepID=A0AAN9UW31_9PEZI
MVPPPSVKKAVWPILERALRTYKIQASLQTHVIEAMLYFSERDSVITRHLAVEQARKLLRKPMPYYLHASVVLFQSILYRIDGDLAKSEARIRDFTWRGPKPITRRDHALQGRLHISQIENKIKCYDNDVPSSIYKWEAAQPLSSLDIEVTFRLQSTAARFFQSVGDFGAAKASLEQSLCLNTTKPIRTNTRRLLVGRVADLYCELQECAKAAEILQPELDSVDEADRPRRTFRRLLLASAEASIGLGRLDAAEIVLRELGSSAAPSTLDDLHDQQLHMRRLVSAARIVHMRADYAEAVVRWKHALREVERMHTLKSGAGFTAAVIHLSLAHAQLRDGDRDGGGRHSWAAGLEILGSERCEFWIPVVPTAWLRRIALEVHECRGWSFRMMLPGGRPDILIQSQ